MALQLVLQAGAGIAPSTQHYEAALRSLQRRRLDCVADQLEEIRTGSSSPWCDLRRRMSAASGSLESLEVARASIASEAARHLSHEQRMACACLWHTHCGENCMEGASAPGQRRR